MERSKTFEKGTRKPLVEWRWKGPKDSSQLQDSSTLKLGPNEDDVILGVSGKKQLNDGSQDIISRDQY